MVRNQEDMQTREKRDPFPSPKTKDGIYEPRCTAHGLCSTLIQVVGIIKLNKGCSPGHLVSRRCYRRVNFVKWRFVRYARCPTNGASRFPFQGGRCRSVWPADAS
jgi:hypothetical protein